MEYLMMSIFQVKSLPNGIENSSSIEYEKIEGLNELDAAQRLLHIPLQTEPRHITFLRALVRGPAYLGTSIPVYAAEKTF